MKLKDTLKVALHEAHGGVTTVNSYNNDFKFQTICQCNALKGKVSVITSFNEISLSTDTDKGTLLQFYLSVQKLTFEIIAIIDSCRA